MCANIPETRVEDFYVADQSCLLSPETSKFIIATIVMIQCTMTLVTLLYRYRWHIRLVLYEAFRGRDERQRRLREDHFRYDVFVSYDKNDLGWVRGNLMRELEQGMGLRLCIHERDFVIGQHIVDNIAESVKTSKKVIMVFSANFAKSPWCQFELNFCLGHVLENDDMLLVVLLSDVQARDLTPAMMAVMKTTTYIEWGDEPDARESFWRRMYIALNELVPAA
nr:hypothetical protein BaRGS_024284 [Batillaria attramentaria]